MDLGAFWAGQLKGVEEWLNRIYGYIPRFRGVRFMKYENKIEEDSYQSQLFNSYIGQDVIYIHTRCGGDEDDENSNYVYFGADEWENKNPDTFLESITDEWDCTYRDHYFKAPVDDEFYQKIIKSFENDEELDKQVD